MVEVNGANEEVLSAPSMISDDKQATSQTYQTQEIAPVQRTIERQVQSTGQARGAVVESSVDSRPFTQPTQTTVIQDGSSVAMKQSIIQDGVDEVAEVVQSDVQFNVIPPTREQSRAVVSSKTPSMKKISEDVDDADDDIANDVDGQTGTQELIENSTVASKQKSPPKQKRTKRMKVAADVSKLRAAAKRGVVRGEQAPAEENIAIDGVDGDDGNHLDLPEDEESDEEYTRNKLLSAGIFSLSDFANMHN
jgi:hypothetical protein